MVGENHSLINDFPEHKDLITALSESNEVFSKTNKEYNALDDEIRNFELDGTPIGDDRMHELKQKRASLKDSLYQILLNEKKK